MIDFPIRAVITAVTAKAETAMDRIKSKLTGISDYSEASSQKQNSAWKRVKYAILGVTAVATGLTAAMVASSPELAAAISEIKFQFQEVANALGNELAPVVEAFIPVITVLTNWFVSLPGPVKQFIALTIALTAVIGTLTVAFLSLAIAWKAGLFPVIAILIGIAAAIAAVIVVMQNWGKIVAFFTNVFAQSMEYASVAWNIFLDVVTQGFGTIKNGWQSVVDWIIDLWGTVVGIFGGVYGFFGDIIEGAWNVVKSIVGAIISVINKVIVGSMNAMVKAINWLLPSWWELDYVTLPNIGSFHQGGIVGQPGTTSDDVLAYVQQGEGYIDASTMRKLKSGGGSTTNMGGVTIIQHFRFNGQVQPRQVMNAAKQGVRDGSKNLQRYTRGGYSS